jgi:hypothetical protein
MLYRFRMSRDDRARWRRASTLDDLGELTARWLERSLESHPGVQLGCGPDPETAPYIEILAAVNRAGFVTIASQPGLAEERGVDGALWQQRAAVEGFVLDPRVLRRVTDLAESAGLDVLVNEPAVHAGRIRYRDGIAVTTRDGRTHTVFGAPLGARDLDLCWSGCSTTAFTAVMGACQVTLVDPAWANTETLWIVLQEAAGLTSDLCRICGCSEHSPCANGCAWVPDPVGPRCSACPADGTPSGRGSAAAVDGRVTGASVIGQR